MKFTSTVLSVIAMISLGSYQTLACCEEGCYSVKGEKYIKAGCAGEDDGASIANYGPEVGNCLDIRNAASLMAHNDGCGSSHPDFHFFKRLGCPGGSTGGYKVLKKRGGGQCFPKPEGAVSMMVVSN